MIGRGHNQNASSGNETKKKTKWLGDWTIEAELVNWTDPVKLPPVLVGGFLLGTATFLQDPKGAPACGNDTCN